MSGGGSFGNAGRSNYGNYGMRQPFDRLDTKGQPMQSYESWNQQQFPQQNAYRGFQPTGMKQTVSRFDPNMMAAVQSRRGGMSMAQAGPSMYQPWMQQEAVAPPPPGNAPPPPPGNQPPPPGYTPPVTPTPTPAPVTPTPTPAPYTPPVTPTPTPAPYTPTPTPPPNPNPYGAPPGMNWGQSGGLPGINANMAMFMGGPFGPKTPPPDMSHYWDQTKMQWVPPVAGQMGFIGPKEFKG